jgi:hypothetical protein
MESKLEHMYGMVHIGYIKIKNKKTEEIMKTQEKELLATLTAAKKQEYCEYLKTKDKEYCEYLKTKDKEYCEYLETKEKNIEAMNEFKNIQSFRSKAFNKSNAFYTIERAGQEDPAKGDRVCVKLRLYLPCEEGVSDLKKDIRFDRRSYMLGIPLWWNWGGYNDDERCRFMEKVFLAETWREAFVEAKEYAEQEIEKLEEAIRNREEALQKAEDD